MQTNREQLLKEQTECEDRLKGAFPDPKDMKRIKEIGSLLLTDGATEKLSFKIGQPKKSRRVTAFSRYRR